MAKKTISILFVLIFVMFCTQPVLRGEAPGSSPLYKISNDEFITLASASGDDKSSSGSGGKSPFAALALAIIPGCIVHGSGYFYAGNKTVGGMLVTTELVSLASFGAGLVLAVLSGVGEIASLGQADLEGNAQTAGILMTAGVIGFAGSWLFDIIGSPIYAIKASGPARTNAASRFAGKDTIRIDLVKVSFY